MKNDWEKVEDDKIVDEFSRLLHHIGDCNGTHDLIDVVEGIPTVEQKRDFVVSWHEQDEDENEDD